MDVQGRPRTTPPLRMYFECIVTPDWGQPDHEDILNRITWTHPKPGPQSLNVTPSQFPARRSPRSRSQHTSSHQRLHGTNPTSTRIIPHLLHDLVRLKPTLRMIGAPRTVRISGIEEVFSLPRKSVSVTLTFRIGISYPGSLTPHTV